MPRLNTIFTKLFISFIIITFLSFILSSVVTTYLFRSNLQHNMKNALHFTQSRVVQYIEKAHQLGWDQNTLTSALQLSIGNREMAYYTYDKSGHLLYSVGDTNIIHNIDSTIIQSALNGKKMANDAMVNHQQVFINAWPITSPKPLKEKVLVTVSYGFARNIRLFTRPALIGFVIMTLIAWIVFLLLSRRLTQPLNEMNRTALEYAKGNFSKTIKVKSKDEIGQLGETLNYMGKELGSLESMRRDFLANVSHDLRSPLTSMNGFITALMDGTIPPEKENHYLQIIKESNHRLMSQVQDLLDMAKMDAGEFSIEKMTYNLTEQMRRILARMEPQCVQHQITLDIDFPMEDIYVCADTGRIDQVIVNIVQNAIQYSNPDSRILVHMQDTNPIWIHIKDEGIGLNEEEIDKIWQRFYKGDKARSKKVGTGIGLSIVKHILDLHDSQIKVESEIGVGTTISFSLERV